MKTASLRAIGLLLTMALTTPAQAHSLGQTYLYLGLSETSVDVRFEVEQGGAAGESAVGEQH